VCGRDNLKVTTEFADAEGTRLYAGSECAQRVTGWTARQIRLAETTQREAAQAVEAATARDLSAWEHAAIREHFGVTDVLAVPRAERRAFLAGLV
jgi:hypothetical protein